MTIEPCARTSGESAASSHRGHGRRRSEAPPRLDEHGHEQAGREGDDRQAAEEEQPVAVVPAIQKTPAELPLPRLAPRHVVLVQRRMERDEGCGREQLHERRLLGVQAVVAEHEVRVARGQVGALVEGRGAAAQDEQAQGHLHADRGGEDERRPPAHGAFGRADVRGTTSSTARAIAWEAMR